MEVFTSLKKYINLGLVIKRGLSTEASKETLVSKRRQFQSIPIDPAVLKRLDLLEIGYISSKKDKEKHFNRYVSQKDHLYQQRIEQANQTPHLFKKIGKKLITISTIDDLKKLSFISNPPEVAIIGRSNVGKSTLLNALIGFNDSYVQKSQTSDKPGETKDLIYYGVKMKSIMNPQISKTSSEGNTDAISLIIADMPGYGFAYMSETDRVRSMELCKQYLLHRGKTLKRVLILLDARHGFKVGDKEFFAELFGNDIGVNKLDIHWKYQLVLTKCDLVERNTVARLITKLESDMREYLPNLHGNMLRILPCSGKDHKGIKDLQKELTSLVSTESIDAATMKRRERMKTDSMEAQTNRKSLVRGRTTKGVPTLDRQFNKNESLGRVRSPSTANRILRENSKSPSRKPNERGKPSNEEKLRGSSSTRSNQSLSKRLNQSFYKKPTQ